MNEIIKHIEGIIAQIKEIIGIPKTACFVAEITPNSFNNSKTKDAYESKNPATIKPHSMVLFFCIRKIARKDTIPPAIRLIINNKICGSIMIFSTVIN